MPANCSASAATAAKLPFDASAIINRHDRRDDLGLLLRAGQAGRFQSTRRLQRCGTDRVACLGGERNGRGDGRAGSGCDRVAIGLQRRDARDGEDMQSKKRHGDFSIDERGYGGAKSAGPALFDRPVARQPPNPKERSCRRTARCAATLWLASLGRQRRPDVAAFPATRDSASLDELHNSPASARRRGSSLEPPAAYSRASNKF